MLSLETSSGVELPTSLVIDARRLEIEYYRRMRVYTKVNKDEALKITGKAQIKV